MATGTILKVRTPVFRLAYCKLWKPDDDGAYGMTAIFDPSSFTPEERKLFKAIVDGVETMLKDKFPKIAATLDVKSWLAGKRPGGFVLPFKKGGETGCETDRNTPWLQNPEFDGMIVCSLKSHKRRVGVLDVNKMLLDPNNDTDTEKVYSGSYGAAFVTPFSFDKDKNKGISLSLQSFMKTKDGDPLAGTSNAEADFEEVDVAKDYGVDNSSALGI